LEDDVRSQERDVAFGLEDVGGARNTAAKRQYMLGLVEEAVARRDDCPDGSLKSFIRFIAPAPRPRRPLAHGQGELWHCSTLTSPDFVRPGIDEGQKVFRLREQDKGEPDY
jgi:hypothetical protein